MDRFDAMRVFTRVVERRSFTLAAEDLALPRSTVTDAVKQLERRLGVRLLQRTTRHVGPTLDGEAYHRRCLALIADLEEAEAAFRIGTYGAAGSARNIEATRSPADATAAAAGAGKSATAVRQSSSSILGTCFGRSIRTKRSGPISKPAWPSAFCDCSRMAPLMMSRQCHIPPRAILPPVTL
jgi:hypothetical protein